MKKKHRTKNQAVIIPKKIHRLEQKLHICVSQKLSPKHTQLAQTIILKRKSNSNIENPKRDKKTNTDKQIQSNPR